MTSVTAITIFASDSTRHETSVHARSRMVNTTTIHRVRDRVNLSKSGSLVSAPLAAKNVEGSTAESWNRYSLNLGNTGPASME